MQFKANRVQGVLKPGQSRSLLAPGSSVFWDAAADVLKPCTLQACPHATVEPAWMGGEPVLVNRAPYSALGGSVLGAVNAQAPPTHQLYMYSLWAYFAQPAKSWEQVSAASSAKTKAWVAAGNTGAGHGSGNRHLNITNRPNLLVLSHPFPTGP